jgi:spore coat polysaccharide biosynthesis predicted glycosyltransferase SpsG
MAGLILFRTDGNEACGMGHFARCLSLAAEARDRGARVAFALRFHDPAVRAALDEREIAYECIPDRLAVEAEGDWLRARFAAAPPPVLFFDVSHPYMLDRAREMSALVGGLRNFAAVIAVLDGLGEHALLQRTPLAADLVVTPYFGARVQTRAAFRHLAGPSYFVFHPDFAAAARTEPEIAADPRRVLVTFGGSDPHAITLKALRALARIGEPRLEVRVVIGPSFAPGLAAGIRELLPQLGHGASAVEAPPTLAGPIAWCEVALSAAGLTKYELALMGRPSLQVSIDPAHAAANTEFEEVGSAWHLGVHSAVSEDALAAALRRLMKDRGARERMSHAGRSLLDTRGGSRILDAAEEIRQKRCSSQS